MLAEPLLKLDGFLWRRINFVAIARHVRRKIPPRGRILSGTAALP
jgi:hypothetical protein